MLEGLFRAQGAGLVIRHSFQGTGLGLGNVKARDEMCLVGSDEAEPANARYGFAARDLGRKGKE
jgi:hypothetical protein